MLLSLNLHYNRVSDLVSHDDLLIEPAVPPAGYRDGFANWCTRIIAHAGSMRISSDASINDSGELDPVTLDAQQVAVPDLPYETLGFLLGSRYCETDRLSEYAWKLFRDSPPGWGSVQAICDFVHRHIVFGYQNADPMRSVL